MPVLVWAFEKRLNVSVFQRRIRTLPKAGRRVRRGRSQNLSRYAILSASRCWELEPHGRYGNQRSPDLSVREGLNHA